MKRSDREFYVKRAKEMGPKPKRSRGDARTYEDGFMSRAQVAKALGLTGFGAWVQVQKALVTGRYSLTNGELTSKAEGLVKMYEDFNPHTGTSKSWMILHPSMVEILRPIVKKNMEAPKDALPGQHPKREYPEGYTSLYNIAQILGASPKRVRDLMLLWGVARMEDGMLVPGEGVDDAAQLYTEINARGKEEKWYVWNIHGYFMNDLKAHFSEHPEELVNAS
jgi:hypothetical protein